MLEKKILKGWSVNMSNGLNDVIYSYSRLSSFNNCPYSYNLTYNENDRGNDSVYTYLGSAVHELLEQLQTGAITNERAVSLFDEQVEECEMLGLEFLTESTKEKYVANLHHFLENFKQEDGQCFIEEEVFIDIEGYKLKGFIDIYFKLGNKIYIFDYKTSRKFAKKELILNGRQLVLYAIALQQKYPECEIVSIGWNMLKYVEVMGARGPKLIERYELQGQDYKDAIVYHIFNEETKQECIHYIVETIKKIETATEYPPLDIKKEYFYCTNLCGHKERCKYYQNFRKIYKK